MGAPGKGKGGSGGSSWVDDRVEALTRHIAQHAQSKELDAAKDAFASIAHEGFTPNKFAYAAMINAHITSGDLPGAMAMLRGDAASRLVPSGFFLRPIDESRETVAAARSPEVDAEALEQVLAAVRESRDRTTNVEAHRLLCTEASVLAYSARRETAARYCRLMAPAAATIRCSICPSELRVSAQDR
jgi:hypothetical protein